MWRLLLIGLVGLPLPAVAGPAEWNPPARYDKPFPGKVVLRELPQRLVVGACDSMFRRYRLKWKVSMSQRGCSYPVGPDLCHVVIMNEAKFGTTPQAVLRHEIGHCNGWHGSHPD